jgi:hypothetical protein
MQGHPGEAGLVRAAGPVELADALLLAEDEDEDEYAAAVRVARLTAAATASPRRMGLSAKRETQFVRFIIVEND